MILQELRDLATAAEWVKSQEFTTGKVHWILRIDAAGKPLQDSEDRFVCWFPLRTDPPSGSRAKPKLGRTVAGLPKVDRRNQNDIKPDFLVGRADRMLFAMEEESAPGRTRTATVCLIRAATKSKEDSAFQAVERFYQMLLEVPSLVGTLFEEFQRESLFQIDPELRGVDPLAELIRKLNTKRKASKKKPLEVGELQEKALSQTIAFSLDVDDFRPAFSRPTARQFWVDHRSKEKNADLDLPADSIRCLCCGQACVPLRIHEGKIKNLPGPGRSGVSLIAYNKEAFQSQGYEDSLNAPMCQQCVDAYTTALNRLLKTDSSSEMEGPSFGGSIISGGLAWCYWSRDPLQADPARLLFDAPVREVEDLLNAVKLGNPAALAGIHGKTFCVLPLSAPSKGRAVVHNWISTTLENAQYCIAAWFEATAIVDWSTGERAEPIKLREPARGVSPVELSRHVPPALGSEITNPEKIKNLGTRWDVPKGVMTSILQSALLGIPLPLQVLQLALIRLRADVHDRKAGLLLGFTSARLGLIRATLNQHLELLWKGEPLMVQLDRNRQDPPYVCGRLLAVLSRLQAKAIAGTNKEDQTGKEREQRLSASVVSRYYNAASSRPATGLYVPIKMRIAHLNKLDRDAPGLAVLFRKELQEIFGLLGSPTNLPGILTPIDQCVFAIGFEHEMAELWKPKRVTGDDNLTAPSGEAPNE